MQLNCYFSENMNSLFVSAWNCCVLISHWLQLVRLHLRPFSETKRLRFVTFCLGKVQLFVINAKYLRRHSAVASKHHHSLHVYRLVDVVTPASVESVVTECLAVGAPLLLPPLHERLQLLQTMLPQGSHLSKGQVIQIKLVAKEIF